MEKKAKITKRIVVFFQETISELRKVVWPTPDKVIENSRIVIISTIVLALFFGAVDYLLVTGIRLVF